MTKEPPKAKHPGGARRRTRRGAEPDDQELWRQVIRDATPLDPGLRATGEWVGPNAESPETKFTRPRSPSPTAPGAPMPAVPTTSRSLRPVGSGKKPAISIDLADRAVAPIGRLEAGLDSRLTDRLRQGERAPDGRIDLHGMTAERAHRALDRYISVALTRGERLILVITGKGGKVRNADDAAFMRTDQGVLRQQAPNWLRNGPYAAHIVGIYQAHLRHGGAGAFYVYLKKQR